MAHLAVLRTYASRADPSTLPPTVRLCHSEFSVTIFDKYPKSHFHFVVLPLIRSPLTAANLHDLRAVLKLPKEQAQTILQNIHRDALEAKKLVEEEMLRSYGFKWGIQMGFHAVPSLDHIHLHIISTDFCGEYMKKKRHLNSFHPKLGFFLHLDEVLSWFDSDVDPKLFATKTRIDKNQHEKLLKDDMTCPHCGEPFKTMPKVNAHLHEVFAKMIATHKKALFAKSTETKMGAKRKAEEEDDVQAMDSHLAKKQHTDSPPAPCSADP